MTYLFYDESDHTYNAIDFDHRISTSWVSLTRLVKVGYSTLRASSQTPEKFLLMNKRFRLLGNLEKHKPTYQDWLETYPEIFI